MSAARRQALLWLAQRTTAAVLALCVVVHLATMIIAVRGGLTAAEILGRTRGSMAWAVFYGVFVLAVSIHGPIGVRNIIAEMRGGHARGIDVAMVAFAILLLITGARAIAGVTMGGGA
jgi:fumarate reductase subunit C